MGTIFLLLVTFLSLFVTITSFWSDFDASGKIFQYLFIPVTLYLLATSIGHIFLHTPALDRRAGWKRIIIYYCFILTSSLVAVSFFSSNTLPEIISSAIFSPLAIYFLAVVLPRSNYASNIESVEVKNNKPVGLPESAPPDNDIDVNRRAFLKLIGAAGITAFVFSLFSRRNVPFFGQVANVEPSFLQDSGGNKIDPAEKSPTDGYYITEIDDFAEISYFGFVNRESQWFIMRQGTDKAFRYARGDDSFSNNWEKRSELNYDYFNNVF